jgi:hypothetical protein
VSGNEFGQSPSIEVTARSLHSVRQSLRFLENVVWDRTGSYRTRSITELSSPLRGRLPLNDPAVQTRAFPTRSDDQGSTVDGTMRMHACACGYGINEVPSQTARGMAAHLASPVLHGSLSPVRGNQLPSHQVQGAAS